jgi:hypothetical protein
MMWPIQGMHLAGQLEFGIQLGIGTHAWYQIKMHRGCCHSSNLIESFAIADRATIKN